MSEFRVLSIFLERMDRISSNLVCSGIDMASIRIVSCHFSQICNRVMALMSEFRFCSISFEKMDII